MSNLKNYLMMDFEIDSENSEDLSLGLEVADSSKDFHLIKEHNLAILELSHILVGLENIIALTDNHIVTKEEYPFFKGYLEHLLKDFPSSIILPSTESYNSDELSVEAIKDAAKKAIKIIKDAAKKAEIRIKTWIDKVFKTNMALKAKCNSLLNDAKKIGESGEATIESVNFNLGNIINNDQNLSAISMNVLNFKETLKTMILEKKVTGVIEIYYLTLTDLSKEMEDKNYVADTQDILLTLADNAANAVEDLARIPTGKGEGKIPKKLIDDNFAIKKHGCLIGNNCLYSITPKGPIKTGNQLNFTTSALFDKAGIVLDQYDTEEYNGKYTETSPTAHGGVIIGLLERSNEIIEVIDKYKKIHSEAETLKHKILEEHDHILATMSLDGEGSEQIRNILKGLPQRLIDQLDHPRLDLIDLGINALPKIFDYCQKSINAYK